MNHFLGSPHVGGSPSLLSMALHLLLHRFARHRAAVATTPACTAKESRASVSVWVRVPPGAPGSMAADQSYCDLALSGGVRLGPTTPALHVRPVPGWRDRLSGPAPHGVDTGSHERGRRHASRGIAAGHGQVDGHLSIRRLLKLSRSRFVLTHGRRPMAGRSG